MPDPTQETRKYIVGWLTFPPGKRQEFLQILPAYVAACRAEPGCLFFEMNPSMLDPDVVTLAECFESEETHATHLKAETFRSFWPQLAALAISGRFENVYPGRVADDAVRFQPA